MKVDLVKLMAEVDADMVRRQKHPTLPLYIYKYTIGCVFESHWNEITLRCRGVVLDEEGNVIINGLKKFFNHDEPNGREAYTHHKTLEMPYTVTEKLDGSLIQAAMWNGQLIVSSSGSFMSPQAVKGREMIEKLGYTAYIEDGKSYLFEIIYPQNRIVLNYKDRESLTLLAIINTEDGLGNALDDRFDCVKSVDMTLEQIETELHRADFINLEGYIVRFADGFMVKMKYAEYMRLHKIFSGVNEKFVWESLRDGINLKDILIDVPDELFDFVQKATEKLKAEFAVIESRGREILDIIKDIPTRKEKAAELFSKHKEYTSLVFIMMDGQNYSENIWDRIKPKFITMTKFGMGEG